MNFSSEGFLLLLRAIAGVEIVYGIPFILRLVPPNKFIGFKMKSVLPDTEAWYVANRIFGVSCVVAGLIAAMVSVVLPQVADEYGRSIRALVIVGFVLVPLVAAVSITRKTMERRNEE